MKEEMKERDVNFNLVLVHRITDFTQHNPIEANCILLKINVFGSKLISYNKIHGASGFAHRCPLSWGCCWLRSRSIRDEVTSVCA